MMELKIASRSLTDEAGKLRRLHYFLLVDELEAVLDRQGLEGLCQGRSGVPFLARPRRQEILACLDRWRGLRF